MNNFAFVPPTFIQPQQRDALRILQLTDLHLYPNPQKIFAGQNGRQNFEKILDKALSQGHCDLILVTGDLASEVRADLYDWIFDRLGQTGVPFACIAGNHDVTEELDTHLPYHLRRFLTREADPRLLSCHVIESPFWQILLLDSSVAGQVSGFLHDETLLWLQDQLKACAKFALVALHHHALPVQSFWLDQHMLQNAQDLWAVLAKFPQVQVLLNGHVHQAGDFYHAGVQVCMTPSTHYQFAPLCDDFAYDETQAAGFRWLVLTDSGQCDTWVDRL